MPRSVRGLDGERLRAVAVGSGVFAVVGDLTAAPRATRPSLEKQDRVVRRLALRADAILPARFGSAVTDEAALIEWGGVAGEALREALALVRRREQMTLWVTTDRAHRPAPDEAPRRRGGPRAPAAGAGTSYLLDRLALARARREAPELATLAPRITPLVHAQRVDRDDPRRLIVVAHLVTRGAHRVYRRAIAAWQATRPHGMRVRVAGPFPPYAFTPELRL